MKCCSIFCAGEYYGYEKPLENSMIIAADGGTEYLDSINITPEYCIGDFDSSSAPNYENVIRLNPVKDETDTYEAVILGIENGCTCFHIFGGTGGRSAHTFANIQTLVMLAENGFKAFLYGDNEVLTVLHNSSMCFSPLSKGYVSVFSLDEKCEGVFEKGLKYSLNNAEILNNFPIGVSNEFIGTDSEIMVTNGNLLVIFTSEAIVK